MCYRSIVAYFRKIEAGVGCEMRTRTGGSYANDLHLAVLGGDLNDVRNGCNVGALQQALVAAEGRLGHRGQIRCRHSKGVLQPTGDDVY